jgi:class 3 adenylate cyclase
MTSSLRNAIEGHGGWLFKHTGDGVCAAFGSPRSAVNFARFIAAGHDAEWAPESKIVKAVRKLQSSSRIRLLHVVPSGGRLMADLVELAQQFVVTGALRVAAGGVAEPTEELNFRHRIE